MGPSQPQHTRFYFLAIVHWSTVYNAGQLQSVFQSRGAKHIMATIVAATPRFSYYQEAKSGLSGQNSGFKRGKKIRKEKSNESGATAPLLKKSNYDRTNQWVSVDIKKF